MGDRTSVKIRDVRLVNWVIGVCTAVAVAVGGYLLRLELKTSATQAEAAEHGRWIAERKLVIQEQEKRRETFEKEVLTRVTRTETIVERILAAVGDSPSHRERSVRQTVAKDQ